ncbi:MAG: hypothetical protein RLZZ66_520 [Pseudomonadota bacterium]|jgi:CheY-like chemotaxis protein
MSIHYLQFSLNILVIEESYEIANMLKRVLFSIGHSVTTFTKQVDALEELMKNKHYDVIITDDFLREQSAVHQHDALTGTHLIDSLLGAHKIPIAVWGVYINELKKHCINNNHVTLFKKPHNTIKDIFSWLEDIPKLNHSHTDTFPIYQIVYASKAIKTFSENDLIDILITSRKYNKQAHLTGALIYHNHCFMQTLEGEQSAVDAMFYNHIAKDCRHYNIAVISQEKMAKRTFPHWAMGFFSSNKEEYELLGSTDFDKHPTGHFFKEKLTQSQDDLLGILKGCFSFL